MVDYAIEKTIILIFSKDELDEVNKTLKVKATLEDEFEIMDFEIETLFNAGLISKNDFNELSKIDEVTKIIVCFKEGEK